ncbi:MAG TPA: DivIVA domain-containing protein [Cyclobacteriaceae bacterium]|nr:DivIVA domain-containing protein [Cyclobacteriaceae bacterium]
MKVTPLEIRQKTFERTLRGYDKDEVNAFLLSLSQEWERMNDEIKELKMKFENSEREVSKLREVETSLFRTLKTAEDTGANVVDQAKKTAELHVREAQINADALFNEAKAKAKNVIEEAENMSRQMLGDMEDNLRSLVQQYKSLESQRNILVDDLTRLASEALDRAERVRQTMKTFNADDHMVFAKREIKKVVVSVENQNKKLQPVDTDAPEHVKAEPVKVVAEPEPLRSFFDEVA